MGEDAATEPRGPRLATHSRRRQQSAAASARLSRPVPSGPPTAPLRRRRRPPPWARLAHGAGGVIFGCCRGCYCGRGAGMSSTVILRSISCGAEAGRKNAAFCAAGDLVGNLVVDVCTVAAAAERMTEVSFAVTAGKAAAVTKVYSPSKHFARGSSLPRGHTEKFHHVGA